MPEVLDSKLAFYVLRKINSEQIDNPKLRGNINGIKISTLNKTIEILNKNNLISNSGLNILNQRGEDLDFECKYCRSGISLKNHNLSNSVKKVLRILKRRPPKLHSIDNQPLKNLSTIMRAAAIYEMESIYNKRIICIGDYDLTSMALSILFRPKEIVVIDVYDKLINFIDRIAKENDLPIKTIKSNLMYELPNQLKSTFDIFITDPPYTVKGMKTFISRGISSLKEEGSGYIALPFHDNLPWTYEMLFEIQKLITDNDFVIINSLKNFHEYKNTDGLTSSLLKIKKNNYHNLNKESFYWYKKNIKEKNFPKVVIKSLKY